MDAPFSPDDADRIGPPVQWTVGQLRAELVGVSDETLLVVDVCLDAAGEIHRRVPLIAAGYGPDVDPSDPLFNEQEYPLTAGYRGSSDDHG